jgi:inner membrane protein
VSSSYLLITVILKAYTYFQFKSALEDQYIEYTQIDTRPAPLNTILWSANVETEDAYLLGYYSLFDTKPISFLSYPKDHQLLDDLIENERVERMIRISKGWYIVSRENSKLYFNDLRFGLLTFEPGSMDFVFKYEITKDQEGIIEFTEVEKDQRDGTKLIKELWERVKGN